MRARLNSLLDYGDKLLDLGLGTGWSRENGEAVTLRSAVAVQRRLLTTTSFVDNNQIVDGRGAVKLGPVLAHESLAPTSVPITRQPPEVGAFISEINYVYISRARRRVNSASLIDLAFLSRSSFSISSAALKPTTRLSSSRAC
jgi:hypothetical protein